MRVVVISILLSMIYFVSSVSAQITITTTSITSCNKSDGIAIIEVRGAASGFDLEYGVDGTFSDKDKFENLSAGYHTATVRDKNTKCEFSKTFTIDDVLKVVISGINASYAVCDPSPFVTLTANVSGGSGHVSSNWPGNSLTITMSASGSVSVTVTDETGCTASAGGEVIIVPIICSRDPNDIIGPEGFGTGKMVSKFKQQPYTIRFENDPDFATAPAQVVRITQPLDNNTDISSLRLSDFGFGRLTFQVPPNRTFYSNRLNVIDSLGIVVDVTAGIDVTKKEAFWIFESIDPNTGLRPTNATSGFLPVNDSTAIGEGFVSYTIKAAGHTKTGDTIHAKANIVFDINDPIATPAIFNTIDAVAPTSKADALPATSDSTSLNITWSGQDDTGGSGVRDYALYVSDNGGAFSIYQTGIKENETTFTGTPGHTYRFFTLATDNVDNQEAMKSAAEVTVHLSGGGGPLPIAWLYFQGQQNGKDVVLNWATTIEINSKQFVVERSLDGTTFVRIGSIQAAGNSSRTTNYKYIDQDASSLNVIILYYRLQQVDLDGLFTYSKVIAIPIKQKVSEITIHAYPNPFTVNITLQVITVTATDETDNAELYSLDGRLLYQRKIAQKGSATVLLDDLPKLASGIYMLRTVVNGKLYTIKMIRESD